MLTLAFDTSFKTAAVALLQDEIILYDAIINSGLNHSETLLPSIEQALKQLRLNISDIDLFACTLGPGSFTGLRVGVSTLKGLLLSLNKPAVGVSSLAALALNVINNNTALICPVMDAGRGQVYIASYSYNSGLLRQVSPEAVVNPDEIRFDSNQEVIFVGEGAIKYRDILMKSPKAKTASNQQQYIRASAVGVLGREKFSRSELLKLTSFVPVYLRAANAKPGRPLFNPDCDTATLNRHKEP